MNSSAWKSGRRIALTTLALVALTACGSSAGGGNVASGKGSIKVDPKLNGVTFNVSSKDFSESIILGQITIDALKAAGASPVDKTNIKGSVNTRTALTSSNIDMYWEYTGTGWITYLKHTKPIADAKQQYTAVADEDLALNHIKWLAPAPFNNTYAFATLPATAQRLGVKTLSDIAKLSKTSPQDVTFCIESEFSTRDDGYPGLASAYGISVPKSNLKLLDTGVIYTETAKGTTCNFGEVFATDGRIQSLKLTTIEDDQKFFPVYNPALTLREDMFKKYPQLADLFAPIAAKLDNDTMRKLNASVDVDGKTAVQVADQWMRDNGFIG